MRLRRVLAAQEDTLARYERTTTGMPHEVTSSLNAHRYGEEGTYRERGGTKTTRFEPTRMILALTAPRLCWERRAQGPGNAGVSALTALLSDAEHDDCTCDSHSESPCIAVPAFRGLTPGPGAYAKMDFRLCSCVTLSR